MRKTVEKKERNREIMTMWLLGRTLKDIGNRYSISAQRVHQILKAFIKKGESLS